MNTTPKLGETRESVKGMLIRLSPEDGEKLKRYASLEASHDRLVRALEEVVRANERYEGELCRAAHLLDSLAREAKDALSSAKGE